MLTLFIITLFEYVVIFHMVSQMMNRISIVKTDNFLKKIIIAPILIIFAMIIFGVLVNSLMHLFYYMTFVVDSSSNYSNIFDNFYIDFLNINFNIPIVNEFFQMFYEQINTRGNLIVLLNDFFSTHDVTKIPHIISILFAKYFAFSNSVNEPIMEFIGSYGIFGFGLSTLICGGIYLKITKEEKKEKERKGI